MIKTKNYEIKSMYRNLINNYKNRVGEYTEFNTEITEKMLKTLENRLLELSIGDML